MQGLSSILSLFFQQVYKFNHTEADKLDSIYHITLKLLWNCIFGVKTLRFCYYVRNVVIDITLLNI